MYDDIPFDVFEEDPDSGKETWETLFKEGSATCPPVDAATANYYLGRIKQDKEKMERYKEQAKQMKDDFKIRVDTWLQSRQSSLDYDIQHCLDMLEIYYEAHKPADGKSISLPEGNIGLYSVSEKYDFDSHEKDVIKYLQDHQLSKYLRIKPEIDKKEIKKAITFDGEKLWIEGIELPNVPYTPKTKVFGIR